MKNIKAIFFCILVCTSLTIEVNAQFGNEFQIGNRFMQQQNYEAALPIFKKLATENPTEYFFFERYIECFIQLKQYNQALEAISELNSQTDFRAQTKVLEGQLYHFLGDTSKAYSIWNLNLEHNPRNLQIHLSTANTMSESKEFEKSVQVLKSARKTFNNPQLFFNDIANTLLQSGNYEGAIEEWINWLTAQPDQISTVQRSLLRFNDPLLNDITILEIDDKLNDISVKDPAYSTLFRFQIWLLQENKLYRRAVASATAFEGSTSNFNYSLFQLGRSLRRNKEYELATQAFEYYIERATGSVKWQSQEELAKVYTEWGKQIDDFNLDFSNQKNVFFRKALEQLDLIIDKAPNYRNFSRVLLLKSEIVLDYSHDLNAAKNILMRLKVLNKQEETAEEFYIQGRIQIANQEHAQARVSLTKSNKLAGTGELAEKTRYFLALTDFFSSDYEFSTIQLKVLGRQNTSYYANDALQLRLWIQEGLNADSTGTPLKAFSEAYFQKLTGNDEVAKEKFLAFITENPQTPLYDDVVLQLSNNPTFTASDSYELTNDFLTKNGVISNRERLMWERAKFADQAYTNDATNPEKKSAISISASQLQTYYEELILDYPQGFYAPYARKRLSELSRKNS